MKTDFRVGQRVWSIERGWGDVFRIRDNSTGRPISVRFDEPDGNGVKYTTYTTDGRRLKNLSRTLFFDRVKITKKALFSWTPKKGEWVAARNVDTEWHIRKFEQFVSSRVGCVDSDGKYYPWDEIKPLKGFNEGTIGDESTKIDFKKGCRVWSFELGWGTVARTDGRNIDSPITVQFDESRGHKWSQVTYTADGRRIKSANRTLFFKELIASKNCFQPPWIPDISEEIAVRHEGDSGFSIREFVGMVGDKFECVDWMGDSTLWEYGKSLSGFHSEWNPDYGFHSK